MAAVLTAHAPTNGLALFASISRLHIVAIGALGALTFGWVFFGVSMPLVCAVAALDWFLVNLLNRVVDIPEDRANGIVGTDFVARNRRALVILGFGTLGVSLALVQVAAPMLTPFRIAFHTLGFAYNWPVLPGKRRIKQLYFWKNTASACGFVLTVFAYRAARIRVWLSIARSSDPARVPRARQNPNESLDLDLAPQKRPRRVAGA
jgi:hypothetical protein